MNFSEKISFDALKTNGTLEDWMVLLIFLAILILLWQFKKQKGKRTTKKNNELEKE